MNSMWHHNHSFWHQKTVFMTSHTHYSWVQNHCIHVIHYICDITATVLWQDPYYIFDIILSVYDISHGEWMKTQSLYLTWYPMYLCNQTHLIDDITTCVCMKSHPLHVWNHRHCVWHHIPSSHNTPLFVCHGTHSVYDIICIIYDVTILCVGIPKLYICLETH